MCLKEVLEECRWWGRDGARRDRLPFPQKLPLFLLFVLSGRFSLCWFGLHRFLAGFFGHRFSFQLFGWRRCRCFFIFAHWNWRLLRGFRRHWVLAVHHRFRRRWRCSRRGYNTRFSFVPSFSFALLRRNHCRHSRRCWGLRFCSAPPLDLRRGAWRGWRWVLL